METRIAVLMMAVVVVSGCSAIPSSNSDSTGESGPSAENGGLQITGFETGQSEIRPGQRTQLKLTMKNYHVEDISIDSIQLYNYQPLEATDAGQSWSERCTPSELRRNINDPPTITCEWTVRAPDDIGEFDSKTASPRLRILYNSRVSNSQRAVNLQFKPFDEIDSNSKETKTIDNGEVTMTISAENPAPLQTGSKVDVNLQNSGHGTVIDQDGAPMYQVDISPTSLFSGKCSSIVELNPAIDDEAGLTCQAAPDASKQVERKMVVSTSYKYQKTPTLNIEVAK